MSFPVITKTGDVATGRQKITSWLQGRPMPFFEEMADDGSGNFDAIQPSQVSDPRPDQGQLGAYKGLQTLIPMCNLMAMLRDTKYAAASRGDLLLHGAQNEMVAAYDVGRMFYLAFS